MKRVIAVLIGLMACASLSAFAESSPRACGTRYAYFVSYVSSGGASGSFQNVQTAGYSSLILRGTQYKTDIQRVIGYTSSGAAYDLTWDAQSQTYCDGVWGRMCLNDYAQVCFTLPYDYVTVETTGTYMANYAIYLGK